MRFIRLALNHTAGIVMGAVASEVPFREEFGGDRVFTIGHDCEMVDLGAIEDHDWTDPVTGKPCDPSRHIHLRMTFHPEGDGEQPMALVHPRDAREKRASAKLHVEGLAGLASQLELREIHDVPCTMDGLRAHTAAKGPRSLHVKIRAWLAFMLPPHEIAQLRLGAGINIAALKWADSVRTKRDPHHGSVREILDRHAQARIDARLRGVYEAHLHRINTERNEKLAAAQARKAVDDLAARLERELNVKSPPPRDVPYITVIQEAIAKAKEIE